MLRVKEICPFTVRFHPFSSPNTPITFVKSIMTSNLLNTKKMRRFEIPTKANVAPLNQEIFSQLEKGLGFVPNLYATIAHSDNGLKRFLDYQNAKTSFNNKEKEAINLVVSQVNECQYCLSAHTVLGKMNGFSEEELIHIRKRGSENSKLKALVALAADITEKRGVAEEALVDDFFEQGYNLENLVDLVLQVSDKTAMNYLHNLTKIDIDFPLAPAL